MKDYKSKLRKLSQQSPWKIALFVLVVQLLLLWQHAIDYWFYLNFNFLFARRAFVKRTAHRVQVRAHWVRMEVTKPHRLAFTLLAVVLLVGLMEMHDIQSALYWSIGWGSVFSLFVIGKSLSKITQSMVKVITK